jgi:hypothetical protein
VELTLFYTRFIELTDRVLPAIRHPSDQLLYLQFFSRTIAVGEKTCRISYRDLSELTGLSVITIKTAVRRLIDHGILRIAESAAAKVAQTYEVLWPTEIKRLQRLERSPMVLLKESGAGGEHYEGILDKLTPEDKEILEILASSLPFEEEKRLRKMAREAALKAGQDPGEKFKELIVLTQFGPERLKKYGH